jgi:hypothetical protein
MNLSDTIWSNSEIALEQRSKWAEYFLGWDRLFKALELGQIAQVGWGHPNPHLVFVLTVLPDFTERALLYRLSDALHRPVYFTIQNQKLDLELSLLLGQPNVITVGVDIPSLTELMAEENPTKKQQVWDLIRGKANQFIQF